MAKLIEMHSGKFGDAPVHHRPGRAAPKSFPATPLQQGMIYHHLRAPESGVDIEQVVIRMAEPLDATCLRRDWQAMIDVHGVFRTRFQWEGLASPLQIEE